MAFLKCPPNKTERNIYPRIKQDFRGISPGFAATRLGYLSRPFRAKRTGRRVDADSECRFAQPLRFFPQSTAPRSRTRNATFFPATACQKATNADNAQGPQLPKHRRNATPWRSRRCRAHPPHFLRRVILPHGYGHGATHRRQHSHTPPRRDSGRSRRCRAHPPHFLRRVILPHGYVRDATHRRQHPKHRRDATPGGVAGAGRIRLISYDALSCHTVTATARHIDASIPKHRRDATPGGVAGAGRIRPACYIRSSV
jgi:hypothetical protein